MTCGMLIAIEAGCDSHLRPGDVGAIEQRDQ